MSFRNFLGWDKEGLFISYPSVLLLFNTVMRYAPKDKTFLWCVKFLHLKCDFKIKSFVFYLFTHVFIYLSFAYRTE